MLKKKIIIISLILVLAIIVFFLTKNPFAKECYDDLRNLESFIKVKISKQYNDLNSERFYYKGETDIKIPILLYHEITKNEPNRDLYYMQTSVEKFEEQIKGLLDEGYSFISYDELVEFYNGNKPLSEKTLLICFDDGWIGNYENAFPILEKYKIPAAIYVVDDLVGTENYFNWKQAKQMNESGLISIYSHGRTHIYYNNETSQTLLSDLETAYMNIENNVGKVKNKVFTYPYGAYREEQIEDLAQVGYIQNLTDDKINHSSTLDLNRLHRFYVKNNESCYTIIKNINEIN